MAACNVPSRTIFTGDNLDILRGINSECVDLIYLDPPFNSNRTYAAPLDSEARGAEFDDVWTLNDMKQEWVGEIELRRPALFHLINSAKLAHGESMAGYLTFMSVRLIELHRILKPNGSIYLHCDDTALHYLKGMMDALFGAERFINNIVWKRATAHNDARRFGRILDHILFYSRGPRYCWNNAAISTVKSDEELAKAYPMQDDWGRYRSSDLTGMEPSRGESGRPWRGYDVVERGRHWAVPRNGRYAQYIEEHFIADYRSKRGVHERLDALDAAGLIHHPERGFWPGLKRYADADSGNQAQNLFLEPMGFTNFSTKTGEYTGWKTQKPLALLERIIKVSSNPEDLVVDPFCGCATACIAAEKLGRDWIGIDKLPQAVAMLTDRAKRELQIPITDDNGRAWQDWSRGMRTETAPPKRTDSALSLLSVGEPSEVRRFLYAKQQGICAGCEHEMPLHVLTIDHIEPRSRGGSDDISNLQLMDSTCNAIKGDRDMAYLRQRLRELGILRNGG